MPMDAVVPAGGYSVRKRFRNEENVRHKKDIPWSKNILDLNNNKFLARTPWAWFRIIGFYIVLYFFIALIVAFWILIFTYAIFKPGRPLWLKGAPGLSVVPGGLSTIQFHSNVQTEINSIADTIDNFLEKLEKSDTPKDIFNAFNTDKTWGYSLKIPVVFIKLNKVYGFTAETYDTESELPDNIPSGLTDMLIKYPGPGKIWLTCETKKSTPVISYLPHPYFDTTTDMKGINRVIALQLKEMPENEDVSVVCKAWAKNIHIEMEYRGKGHAEFSINMKFKTESTRRE